MAEEVRQSPASSLAVDPNARRESVESERFTSTDDLSWHLPQRGSELRCKSPSEPGSLTDFQEAMSDWLGAVGTISGLLSIGDALGSAASSVLLAYKIEAIRAEQKADRLRLEMALEASEAARAQESPRLCAPSSDTWLRQQ